MNDLISIIITVYNIENYIEKCIQSIINQTYKNLEIIIIDDGSIDSSGLICDEFSKKDKRIKVYHTKNNGIARARNYGIKKTNGKYIFFIDGDDYVDLDIIEFLYKTIGNASISCCNFHLEFENASRNYGTIENILYECSSEEALEKLFYSKICSVMPWGKLYKKNLFNNIKYPNGKVCEDLATTYLLFAKSKKVIINTIAKYYYVQRKSSLMHEAFSKDRVIVLDILPKQRKFIEKKYPLIINSLYNHEFKESLLLLFDLPLTNDYKVELKKIKENIKRTRRKVIFDKNVIKNYKIYAILSYFGIKTIAYIHKLKIKLNNNNLFNKQ